MATAIPNNRVVELVSTGGAGGFVTAYGIGEQGPANGPDQLQAWWILDQNIANWFPRMPHVLKTSSDPTWIPITKIADFAQKVIDIGFVRMRHFYAKANVKVVTGVTSLARPIVRPAAPLPAPSAMPFQGDTGTAQIRIANKAVGYIHTEVLSARTQSVENWFLFPTYSVGSANQTGITSIGTGDHFADLVEAAPWGNTHSLGTTLVNYYDAVTL